MESVVRVLEGHTGSCLCVASLQTGGRVVSGSQDCTVRLWNVQTGALLKLWLATAARSFSVTYSPIDAYCIEFVG